MSVKCELCEGRFDRITGSHLRSVHGLTTDAYRAMFPGADFYDSDTRRPEAVAEIAARARS